MYGNEISVHFTTQQPHNASIPCGLHIYLEFQSFPQVRWLSQCLPFYPMQRVVAVAPVGYCEVLSMSAVRC
jgi:hypothetical protein